VIALGAEPASLDTLLASSDLITLHCPSLPETKGLVNARSIATMKPGVRIVNLSRGDLVEPAALCAALDSGHVAGAALDVFAPEPIPAGHPILGRPNVVLAPHIASVSAAAVHRLRSTAAEIAAATGRAAHQAPEVDGCCVFTDARDVAVGELVRARVVGTDGVDLVVEALEVLARRGDLVGATAG
jgi:phosphoglycerate dehydrogenase-like enzyme